MSSHDQTIPEFVTTDLASLDLTIDEPTLARLATYLDLLLEANTRINLTAIRQRDDAWRKLIIDSLTALPGLAPLERGALIIDVGTGGGLPGMPLAIARPDLRFTLLDSTGKKVKQVQEMIDAIGLDNVIAIQDRAESLGQHHDHRQRYDVAICRAVGPMVELLEYTMPLVKIGGCVLAMKGPKAVQELMAAGDALAVLGNGEVEVFSAYPESFDNDLVIVQVTKHAPTAKDYPRPPGTPRHEPIGS